MSSQLKPLVLIVLVLTTMAFFIPQFVDMQRELQALRGEVGSLSNEVAPLRAQAQAANDYIAVANLQTTYGYYVDKSRWDDVAALFTDDATLEIAGRGLFVGRDNIRTYLEALGPMEYGRMYNHMQLQPVIHIAPEGNTAKARWRSFMMVGKLGAEARWGEATYENEYRKENGLWKISKLHSYIGFYVDYDTGWNKGAVELPGTKENTTPDGAPTVQYSPFPEPFIPPYHYPNPVTGQ
jgi:hypothetical protein